MTTPPTMPTLLLGGAMAALVNARQLHAPRAVLVATMSAQFALDALGETTRRIDSVPLMGGAAGLGLGIALAQPGLPVVVVDGDASLLMELGGLVTVAHHRPANFLHIVVANRVQFNGLRNLPAASAEPTADFCAMARAAGYVQAQRIDSHAAWVAALPALMGGQGARFVELAVRPDVPLVGAARPQPILPDLQFVRMRLGVRKLRAELQGR